MAAEVGPPILGGMLFGGVRVPTPPPKKKTVRVCKIMGEFNPKKQALRRGRLKKRKSRNPPKRCPVTGGCPVTWEGYCTWGGVVGHEVNTSGNGCLNPFPKPQPECPCCSSLVIPQEMGELEGESRHRPCVRTRGGSTGWDFHKLQKGNKAS